MNRLSALYERRTLAQFTSKVLKVPVDFNKDVLDELNSCLNK